MTEMTYREAVCKALADELRADEDVIYGATLEKISKMKFIIFFLLIIF